MVELAPAVGYNHNSKEVKDKQEVNNNLKSMVKMNWESGGHGADYIIR